ncbi:MAG TPA: nickel-dependent lactate racemase [Syntrophales bacterium]|nr:nickel-dependent lactate racemase [Syntrophales bacterium]
MKVLLKYGKKGIPLEIKKTPGFIGILTPSDPEPIKDPAGKIAESYRKPIESKPLDDVARGRKNACIVVSDITRPVPNTFILPPLLKIIEAAGIPRSEITILISTGIHRPSTKEEHIRLVGPDIANLYKVVDHFSKNREDMVEVGKIQGKVPALVNRLYVNADLKILTGFIEPHMWAGYSGGRKSILPGISSIETLEFMHGPEMIAHPSTEYGMLEGNLFHEAGLEIMEKAGADFVVNVTLNTKKEVTGVFSGHPVKAHLIGCDFLARHCVREVDALLDFIVTTNSGAPLDLNFYQTVKGITGAATVVKPQGDIIIASCCNEGAGSPEYKEILNMVDSPSSFICRLMQKDFFIPDQWCAQETYQIMLDRDVWIYTDGLTTEEVKKYHLHPVKSIPETIQTLLEKHGPNARWAVIPDGPMVILKLAGRS